MTTLEAWLTEQTKGNMVDRTSKLKPCFSGRPKFGNNVQVISPPKNPVEAKILEARLATILRNVCPLTDDPTDWRGGQNGHFSEERHALLFKPGTYPIDVQVGYYTQVLGLGSKPSDVTFTGGSGTDKYSGLGPYMRALDQRTLDRDGINGAGSLNTFWRSVENVKVANSKKQMIWAVSQAAPLRRIEVDGKLWLFDFLSQGSNFSSGGFAADCYVSDVTIPGSQQQFFLRNCTFGKKVENCAWSLVTCGCENDLPTTTMKAEGDSAKLVSREDKTKIIAEKPYLSTVTRPKFGKDDETEDAFVLRVPRVKTASSGVSFMGTKADEEDVIPFEYIYYADAEVLRTTQYGVTKSIQDQLDKGYSVVFAPGTFVLTKTLTIKTANQVLLGIGMTTIKPPSDGSPAIKVLSGVDGVRIAGITLQASKLDAGKLDGSTLLEWGKWAPPSTKECTNPGVLSDVFARAGGPDAVDRTEIGVDVMIRINSKGVLGDDLWLWRADHSALAPGEPLDPEEAFHLVRAGEFPAHTAIQVFGDDVTIYGLACEHTIHNITHWFGDNGTTLFYQCELPYDVAQSTFGNLGYAGYVVDDSVKKHHAIGLGVYSFFRDHQVMVKSGLKAQAHGGHKITNCFTRYLNEGGHYGISNVINNLGGPSYTTTGPTGTFPIVYSFP